jgi:hypothetical protein
MDEETQIRTANIITSAYDCGKDAKAGNFLSTAAEGPQNIFMRDDVIIPLFVPPDVLEQNMINNIPGVGENKADMLTFVQQVYPTVESIREPQRRSQLVRYAYDTNGTRTGLGGGVFAVYDSGASWTDFFDSGYYIVHPGSILDPASREKKSDKEESLTDQVFTQEDLAKLGLDNCLREIRFENLGARYRFTLYPVNFNNNEPIQVEFVAESHKEISPQGVIPYFAGNPTKNSFINTNYVDPPPNILDFIKWLVLNKELGDTLLVAWAIKIIITGLINGMKRTNSVMFTCDDVVLLRSNINGMSCLVTRADFTEFFPCISSLEDRLESEKFLLRGKIQQAYENNENIINLLIEMRDEFQRINSIMSIQRRANERPSHSRSRSREERRRNERRRSRSRSRSRSRDRYREEERGGRARGRRERSRSRENSREAERDAERAEERERERGGPGGRARGRTRTRNRNRERDRARPTATRRRSTRRPPRPPPQSIYHLNTKNFNVATPIAGDIARFLDVIIQRIDRKNDEEHNALLDEVDSFNYPADSPDPASEINIWLTLMNNSIGCFTFTTPYTGPVGFGPGYINIGVNSGFRGFTYSLDGECGRNHFFNNRALASVLAGSMSGEYFRANMEAFLGADFPLPPPPQFAFGFGGLGGGARAKKSKDSQMIQFPEKSKKEIDPTKLGLWNENNDQPGFIAYYMLTYYKELLVIGYAVQKTLEEMKFSLQQLIPTKKLQYLFRYTTVHKLSDIIGKPEERGSYRITIDGNRQFLNLVNLLALQLAFMANFGINVVKGLTFVNEDSQNFLEKLVQVKETQYKSVILLKNNYFQSQLKENKTNDFILRVMDIFQQIVTNDIQLAFLGKRKEKNGIDIFEGNTTQAKIAMKSSSQITKALSTLSAVSQNRKEFSIRNLSQTLRKGAQQSNQSIRRQSKYSGQTKKRFHNKGQGKEQARFIQNVLRNVMA